MGSRFIRHKDGDLEVDGHIMIGPRAEMMEAYFRPRTCPECHGSGYVRLYPHQRTCPICQGRTRGKFNFYDTPKEE